MNPRRKFASSPAQRFSFYYGEIGSFVNRKKDEIILNYPFTQYQSPDTFKARFLRVSNSIVKVNKKIFKSKFIVVKADSW